MTLHLHRATRTDVLADALAELLAVPLDDPFAEEVVVVPAKGVERWLTQRLSHRLGASAGSSPSTGFGPGANASDGVCAGVRFLNPRSLVALLTGTEQDDPWDPDRFVWPLLRVIDASLDEPWCTLLARHLGHGVPGEQGELRRNRRYAVARRLAGLFASYALQRPQLLTDWREGRDTDGVGSPLSGDLEWQPELWRRLLAEYDEGRAAGPPDERHRQAVAAVRAGRELALPSRLSMFGHTRMPATELELLRAVGEVREVHLWLPQPSPAGWRKVAPEAVQGPVRRRDDRSGRVLTHPLLASLGRDSRELQRSIPMLGPLHDDELPTPPDRSSTLLAKLQVQLRRDEVVVEPGPPDTTVQVHACHGPGRQVEVLREVLVGLLQDDPTLEPRDILVMCPDVEAYAPLFSAAFGLAEAAGGGGHPGHQLRVRLADRGLGSTNPLLALAGALVRIAGGRATASEVLDLAGSAPVRRRFGIDDDDLAEVTGWVERSGVRWGLTADLRTPYGLEAFDENTWQLGLDRVLLGAAVAEDGTVLGQRLPLDDVGSSSIDLAGRLAELVDRLEEGVVALREATTVADWVDALRSSVRALGDVTGRDAWMAAQFDRELESVLDAARGGSRRGTGVELGLADVRTLLELRLEPRPTRANFRTGHLTVATLVPMRSVPHRVVCLVGLDDGVFPRTTTPDGDDVLARDPMTGERDARSEDRQLLLDAVLAARDTLVVTYTGANVSSNQERPPAVPLAELLDALEAVEPGARERVVRRHPLQPFDPRNFGSGDAGPFSFDRAAREAAGVLVGERRKPLPFLTTPLPLVRRPDLGLADLHAFFRSPVRGFLRQGLDVATHDQYDEPRDAMPVKLEGLEEWAIGDRVLRRVLESPDPQSVLTAELLRGELPPRQLGVRTMEEVCRRVQELRDASAADRSAEPTSLDVTIDLGSGRRLTGVVPDVRGDRIVRVAYSRLAAKHRIAAWLDLLALATAFPDRSWTAVAHGWSKKGAATSLLGPLDDRARGHLLDLVDTYDRGLTEPLPLFAKSSAAWAAARHRGRDPLRDAGWAWRDGNFPGEQSDAEHVLVHGRGADLERLLGAPLPDEMWAADEPTRLGQYAQRTWRPLLAVEKGRNL